MQKLSLGCCMRGPSCFLVATAACLLALLQVSSCQQDITSAQIPTFTVGTFYPSREGLTAVQVEEVVCRAIVDQIERNSARFLTELVSNTNNRINFVSSDSRIMSSRMQSQLDVLANLYYYSTGREMTILKAWSPYPDPSLSSTSLHYEGENSAVSASNC